MRGLAKVNCVCMCVRDSEGVNGEGWMCAVVPALPEQRWINLALGEGKVGNKCLHTHTNTEGEKCL